jgi:uncharacterized repeat protein (TIGR03803 family)
VYKLAPDGTFTVLDSFGNYGSEGDKPYAGVIQDSAGTLYGTTLYGGASGVGTVYKLAPDGTFTVLHAFNYSDGANPYAGLIQDSAGTLYGTAQGGGTSGRGVVFAIRPDADGDGYSTAEDCDDHDATVYPGAPELCDGKDNNCSGTVDEGFDVGASCSAGVGDCAGTGTKACTADGQGTQCNATPKPDGTTCNDGHTCTVADSCQAGMCTYGAFLWSDVLQPLNADGSSIFKLGSTIPVKFKLTGACAGITNLIAKIYVAKIDNVI